MTAKEIEEKIFRNMTQAKPRTMLENSYRSYMSEILNRQRRLSKKKDASSQQYAS